MSNKVKTPLLLEFLKRSAVKSEDVIKLHELLPELCSRKLLAIYFRFWECLTIHEISKILGNSWDETDKLIESALTDLRQGFLNKNNFEQFKIAA